MAFDLGEMMDQIKSSMSGDGSGGGANSKRVLYDAAIVGYGPAGGVMVSVVTRTEASCLYVCDFSSIQYRCVGVKEGIRKVACMVCVWRKFGLRIAEVWCALFHTHTEKTRKSCRFGPCMLHVHTYR